MGVNISENLARMKKKFHDKKDYILLCCSRVSTSKLSSAALETIRKTVNK